MQMAALMEDAAECDQLIGRRYDAAVWEQAVNPALDVCYREKRFVPIKASDGPRHQAILLINTKLAPHAAGNDGA